MLFRHHHLLLHICSCWLCPSRLFEYLIRASDQVASSRNSQSRPSCSSPEIFSPAARACRGTLIPTHFLYTDTRARAHPLFSQHGSPAGLRPASSQRILATHVPAGRGRLGRVTYPTHRPEAAVTRSWTPRRPPQRVARWGLLPRNTAAGPRAAAGPDLSESADPWSELGVPAFFPSFMGKFCAVQGLWSAQWPCP